MRTYGDFRLPLQVNLLVLYIAHYTFTISNATHKWNHGKNWAQVRSPPSFAATSHRRRRCGHIRGLKAQSFQDAGDFCWPIGDSLLLVLIDYNWFPYYHQSCQSYMIYSTLHIFCGLLKARFEAIILLMEEVPKLDQGPSIIWCFEPGPLYNMALHIFFWGGNNGQWLKTLLSHIQMGIKPG